VSHTPGPWRIYVGARDETIQVGTADLNGDGDYIAEIYDERNARLITAAPDLLEALLLLVRPSSLLTIGPKERVLNVARAAIAKATGTA